MLAFTSSLLTRASTVTLGFFDPTFIAGEQRLPVLCGLFIVFPPASPFRCYGVCNPARKTIPFEAVTCSQVGHEGLERSRTVHSTGRQGEEEEQLTLRNK